MSLMDTVYGGGINKLTQERRKATADEVRKLLASKPDATAGERIGTSFGASFGKSLGRGMFGDPERDAAQAFDTDMQQVYSTFKKGDPRGAQAVIDVLNKHGKYKEANQMVAQMTAQAKLNTSGGSKSTAGKLADDLKLEGDDRKKFILGQAAKTPYEKPAHFSEAGAVKDYQNTTKVLRDSEIVKTNLTTMNNMLKSVPDGNFGTMGPGAEAYDTLNNIMVASGIGTDKQKKAIAENNMFRATATKLTLDILAGQSGTKTDFDAEQAAQTIPNLKNDAVSNRFIANLGLAVIKGTQNKRDFQDRLINEAEENGTELPSGRQLIKAWKEHSKNIHSPAKTDPIMTRPNGGPLILFYEFEQESRASNPKDWEDGVRTTATLTKRWNEAIKALKKAKKNKSN
tara:strand:- start:67 stop:1266 length:1200 start_codon:yes stop_codon:yes gene_type:complete